MIYGFIICAGKQSRFEIDTPKALVPIDGKPLLDINIDNMNKYCDIVYVVCSKDNKKYFKNYSNLIVIESGFGSGDAVLKAINSVFVKDDVSILDSCFIQWGDSLQKEEIYKYCIDNYKGITLIPCVKEEKPYVQIIQKDKDHVNVLFSKFGDSITNGYHDLCLFYCNAAVLHLYLKDFYDLIYNEETESFVHKHNNEMEFLDVFNDVKLPAQIIEVPNYKSFSFNTVNQYKELVGGNNEI